jgi:hypothetical protein
MFTGRDQLRLNLRNLDYLGSSSSGKRVPGLLVLGRPVAFTTVKLLREAVQIEIAIRIGIEFRISESQGNFH